MTDQERPAEERNELLDDLVNAATAVEEPAESQQPAADEQPETAEQPATATTDAELEASAEQSADAAAVQPSSETPLSALVDPYAAPAVEPEGASYTPVAEEDSGKPRRVKDLEAGMELEGRVTSIALYGIFVDIGVGRDGLVHISEMSDTRIDSPSDVVQIGDTVHVRIKSVDPDGRRISLTMRSKDRSKEPRGRRKPELDREKLASLRVGDNVEGTVTGIAPFGVFVDIGVGKDGLVHVSELAEGRIEKAEDAVEVGQTYTFKVLEVDAEGTRISLSLRRAQRGQKMAQLEPGQIMEGTVSGLAPFGAFVDIGVGRDGLVHISELSDQRVAKVEDVLTVGDKVTVRVLEVDPNSKRISLSLRLEDRPRETPVERTDAPAEPRADRGRRDERPPRGPRRERNEEPRTPEVYTSTDEPEEDFSGDATIEDLLSKFGGTSKRDRKRRNDEDDEDMEDRQSRRQRDAIRRTIQHMDDE